MSYNLNKYPSDKIKNTYSNLYPISQNNYNPQYIFIEKLKTFFMTIIEKGRQTNNMKICLFNSQDFNPNLIFSSIDTQNKNYIDLNDFKTFFQKNSIIYNELTLRKFIHLYNKHKNFRLIYDDFYLMLKPIDVGTELRGGGTIDELLKSIFEGYFELIESINEMIIDIRKSDYFTSYEAFLEFTKGNKYIDEEFLINFLEHGYNKNEIKHLLYLMDLNNDGLVSYEEFIDFLTPLAKYRNYVEVNLSNEMKNYNSSFENDFIRKNNNPIYSRGNYYNETINQNDKDYDINNINNNYFNKINKGNYNFNDDESYNQNRASYCKSILELSHKYNNYKFENNNNNNNNNYLKSNLNDLSSNYKFQNVKSFNNEGTRNEIKTADYSYTEDYGNQKYDNQTNNFLPKLNKSFNNLNNSKINASNNNNNFIYESVFHPPKKTEKKFEQTSGVKFEIIGKEKTLLDKKTIEFQEEHKNIELICSKKKLINESFKIEENININILNDTPKKNNVINNDNINSNINQNVNDNNVINNDNINNNVNNNINQNVNDNAIIQNNDSFNNNFNQTINDNNIVGGNDNINNNTNQNINDNINNNDSINNKINQNINYNNSVCNNIDNINNNVNQKINKNISHNIKDEIKSNIDDNINNVNNYIKTNINDGIDDTSININTRTTKKINNSKQAEDNEEYINDFAYGVFTNSANAESNKKIIITTIKNINNDSVSLQNNSIKNHIIYVAEENNKSNYNEIENDRVSKISENIFYNDSIQYFIKYIQEIIECEKKTFDLKEKLCLREDITLKDLFCVFDFQQKNRILVKDFKSICKNILKLYPTTDQVNLIFNRYDKNQDGSLNTTEFFYMIKPIKNEYAYILLNKKKNVNKNLAYKQLSEKSKKLIINVIRSMIEDEGKYYKLKHNVFSDKLFDIKELWEVMAKYADINEENEGMNKGELNKFLIDCGLIVSNYDLDIIFNKIDFDGDKIISYDDLVHEFINYF